MYSMFKRVSVLALALLTLVMGVVVPYRRAEAALAYNNTTYANINCSVSSNGKLQVSLQAFGIQGKTTRISVELYVEKKIIGIFWTRVNIGYPDNIWTDSTTSFTYSNNFLTNLSSTGTYRVTAIFTVSGSGGTDDIIEKTGSVTY